MREDKNTDLGRGAAPELGLLAVSICLKAAIAPFVPADPGFPANNQIYAYRPSVAKTNMGYMMGKHEWYALFNREEELSDSSRC